MSDHVDAVGGNSSESRPLNIVINLEVVEQINKLEEIAINISKEALKETEKANELAYKANSISNRNFKVNFIVIVTTLALLISTIWGNNLSKTAMRDANTRFEIENTPFLDVVNIHFHIFTADEGWKLTYGLINQGKGVVLTDSIKVSTQILNKNDFDNFLRHPWISAQQFGMEANMIHISSVPQAEKDLRLASDNLTDERISDIKRGKLYFIVVGRIVYNKSMKQQPRLYRFAMVLNPESEFQRFQEMRFRFLFNQNTGLENESKLL